MPRCHPGGVRAARARGVGLAVAVPTTSSARRPILRPGSRPLAASPRGPRPRRPDRSAGNARTRSGRRTRRSRSGSSRAKSARPTSGPSGRRTANGPDAWLDAGGRRVMCTRSSRAPERHAQQDRRRLTTDHRRMPKRGERGGHQHSVSGGRAPREAGHRRRRPVGSCATGRPEPAVRSPRPPSRSRAHRCAGRRRDHGADGAGWAGQCSRCSPPRGHRRRLWKPVEVRGWARNPRSRPASGPVAGRSSASSPPEAGW